MPRMLGTAVAAAVALGGLALTAPVAASGIHRPPRGWNSYDSFNWVISEDEFRQQAQLVAEKLLPFGYDTVVIDYLWAQTLAGWNSSSPPTLVIDNQGRWQPDPARWPSSSGERGFNDVADFVHGLGLRFGIHIMRGIAKNAVEAALPIPGAPKGATTATIADSSMACPWYEPMLALNTSAPGAQAWMDSVYAQYSDWGVDFIKNDCTFGGNYDEDNIRSVAMAMERAGGSWVYSLSPGHVAPEEYGNAEQIMRNVSMYRVAGDDWDNDGDLLHHFAAAAEFWPLIGAAGREGGQSFPDLDMLPFGYIATPCGNRQDSPACKPNHFSSLTQGQQRMQMTLWGMARSPLMFGGDMTKLDSQTLQILTNEHALAVNEASSANRCVLGCSSASDPTGSVVWAAEGPSAAGASSPPLYAAFFNAASQEATISVPVSKVGGPSGAECTYVEAWSNTTGTTTGGTLRSVVPPSDAQLFVLRC